MMYTNGKELRSKALIARLAPESTTDERLEALTLAVGKTVTIVDRTEKPHTAFGGTLSTFSFHPGKAIGVRFKGASISDLLTHDGNWTLDVYE